MPAIIAEECRILRVCVLAKWETHAHACDINTSMIYISITYPHGSAFAQRSCSLVYELYAFVWQANGMPGVLENDVSTIYNVWLKLPTTQSSVAKPWPHLNFEKCFGLSISIRFHIAHFSFRDWPIYSWAILRHTDFLTWCDTLPSDIFDVNSSFIGRAIRASPLAKLKCSTFPRNEIISALEVLNFKSNCTQK